MPTFKILTVLTLCDAFLCTLLTSNNMISLTVWCNKHLERLQIAFARWAYAILLSLKNLLVLILTTNCIQNRVITYTNI